MGTMKPGARKLLALFTAACFAASGIGAYVHLALFPHHFCPEHHRFEAEHTGRASHHVDGAGDLHSRLQADPDDPDPIPSDDHHACQAMAFATTAADLTPLPAHLSIIAPPLPQNVSFAPVQHIGAVAAFRLAPKASPPA